MFFLVLAAGGTAALRQSAEAARGDGESLEAPVAAAAAATSRQNRVTWPDNLRDLEGFGPNVAWRDEARLDASPAVAAPTVADVGKPGKKGVTWRDEGQPDAGLKDVEEQGPGMDWLAWGKVPSAAYHHAMAKISAHGHVLCDPSSASSRDATGFFAESLEEFKDDLFDGLNRYRRQTGRRDIMAAIDGIVSDLVEHQLAWAETCTVVSLPMYTQALKHGLDVFDFLPERLQSIVRKEAGLRMNDPYSVIGTPVSEVSMRGAALHMVEKWVQQVTDAVTKRLNVLLLLGDGRIILDSAFAKLIEEAVVKHIGEWVTNTEQDVPEKFSAAWLFRMFDEKNKGEVMALKQLRKVVDEKAQQLAEPNAAL